jgi:hypothetical protein
MTVTTKKENVQSYDVGTYRELQKRSVVGDGLDIHHVPQGQPAGEIMLGYKYKDGVAVALTEEQHRALHSLTPTLKAGEFNGGPRDLLARDIVALRKIGVSNDVIRDVLRQNKINFTDFNKPPHSGLNNLDHDYIVKSYRSGSNTDNYLSSSGNILANNIVRYLSDYSFGNSNALAFDTNSFVQATTDLTKDVLNYQIVGKLVTRNPVALYAGSIGNIGTCYTTQADWLKDHRVYNGDNGAIALSYCERNATVSMMGINKPLQYGSTVMTSWMHQSPEDLYNLHPHTSTSILEHTSDILYEGIYYLNKGISGINRTITQPASLILDSVMPTEQVPYANAAFEYSQSNNISPDIDLPYTHPVYSHDYIQSDRDITHQVPDTFAQSVPTTHPVPDTFAQSVPTTTHQVPDTFAQSVYDIPAVQDVMKNIINDFIVVHGDNNEAQFIDKSSFNELHHQILNPETTPDNMDTQFDSSKSILDEFRNNLASELPDTAKFNNTMSKAISVLSMCDHLKHFPNMSDKQIMKYCGSLIMNQMSTCTDFINKCGENVAGGVAIIGNLLAQGKVRVEDIVGSILENKCGIPCAGLKSLVTSLVKHKDIGKSVGQMGIDLVTYLCPQLQAVYLIYCAGTMVVSMITHTHTGKLGGFDVLYSERASTHGFHINRKVVLKCDILGIDITTHAKHTAEARTQAQDEFVKQATIKAYQVFGTPYDYFDPNRKSPETRYEKYSEARFLQTVGNNWKDINNLSENDKNILARVKFETPDAQNTRIECQILHTHNSFWNEHRNENIFHFTAQLLNDFRSCKDITEIAEKLYSLNHITGHRKGEEIVLNNQLKFILEHLGINTTKLMQYINNQVNMSDADLAKQKEKAKNGEQQAYMKMLTKLRDSRTTQQNKDLNTSVDSETVLFEANSEKYTRSQIIIYANQELIYQEIGAEHIFTCVASSCFGVLVSSVIYMDYEIQAFKQRSILEYTFNKVNQFGSSSAQGYLTAGLTNHSVTTIGLIFDSISDDVLSNIVAPHIAIGAAFLVSSGFCIQNDTWKNQNTGERFFTVCQSAMQANVVIASDWLSKTAIIQEFKYMNYLAVAAAATKNPMMHMHHVSLLHIHQAQHPIIYWISHNSLINSLAPIVAKISVVTKIAFNPWVLPFLFCGTTRVAKDIILGKTHEPEFNNNAIIERKNQWNNDVNSWFKVYDITENINDKKIILNHLIKLGAISNPNKPTFVENPWSSEPPGPTFGQDL